MALWRPSYPQRGNARRTWTGLNIQCHDHAIAGDQLELLMRRRVRPPVGAGAASRRPDYAAGVPPSGQVTVPRSSGAVSIPCRIRGWPRSAPRRRGGWSSSRFPSSTRIDGRPGAGPSPATVRVRRGLDTPGLRTRWRGRQWTACVAGANGLPVVAAGDFNSSPSVQGQERASQRFLQRMRDELGWSAPTIHCSDESHGEETRASYYHGEGSQPVPHRLLLRARGVGGSSHRGGGRPLRRLVPERSSAAHRGHRRRVAVETDR